MSPLANTLVLLIVIRFSKSVSVGLVFDAPEGRSASHQVTVKIIGDSTPFSRAGMSQEVLRAGAEPIRL
jgi:hypothetical protein